MKKYLILLVPLLFLMAQCHKTPTPEPTPTPPTFKSTFSCYINGKFWQAYQPPSSAIITWSPGKLLVLYDNNPKDGYVWIQAKRDTLDIKETITIGTKFGQGSVGRYVLSSNIASIRLTNCLWDMDSDSTKSWIEIESIDTSKRILKGAFECKSSTNYCGNGVISNGSFEVKY